VTGRAAAPLLVILGIAISSIRGIPPAAANQSDDGPAWAARVGETGGSVVIGAQQETHQSSQGRAPGRPRIIYEVEFIPKCRIGAPAIIAATASCEPEACKTSGNRLGQVKFRTFRPRDSAAHNGFWTRGSEVCIADASAPKADLEAEIRRAFRSMNLPALTVQSSPAGRTFVHLPTTFSVQRPAHERDLGIILKHRIRVSFEPVSYRWSFGDGSVRTTSVRGKHGPDASVRHSFSDPATVEVSVRTTYRARYRVDGGSPREIPDPVSVAGPATVLPVEQARTELVAPPR
jgi:hypothetical protein